MKTLMRVLTLCVVAMVTVGVARADWPSLEVAAPRAGGGERDVALVISIEDYAVLPDVAGAESNAQAWVQWFERTRGVRPDRVVHLKNNEGTPRTILSKASELAEEADSGGMIWVVFIGHGAPSEDEKEGVLVGWGAQQTPIELYANSLRQSALLEALGRGLKAPITLVVDACFSGKSGDGTALARGLQPVLLAGREEKLPRAVTLLSAGRSDQFAGPLPGASRPAFSYLLLGALRGWGDDKVSGYGNGDGLVTTEEAVAFARAALRATLKGRSQTPEAAGAKPVLSRKATERAPDLSALKALADSPDVGVVAERLGGGAALAGDGLDLSQLDLDALGEAQRLKESIDRAKSLDSDVTASARSKAAAWDAVASLRVKGANPYSEEARRNAASWRAWVAKVPELRENWLKVKAALKLSVLGLEKKRSLVDQFLGAYSGLSSEAEYQEASSAKRALASGNAFPLGGGGVASGSGRSGGAPSGFVEIPAGVFMMGSPSSEEGRYDDETQREVRITRPFWLKTTEVTQGEWESVMGSNPSHFSSCGKNCPVENVSWFDAIGYMNKLSEREGLERCYESDGRFKGLRCTGYRLPTEAEWEYAARAGTTGARYGSLDSVGWYSGNSGGRTQAVGQKTPNAWGLYDMLGNVYEWVQDWYGAYPSGAVVDPLGPYSGARRVGRGGDWDGSARGLRAAFRAYVTPGARGSSLGFRLSRSMP